MRAWKAGRHRRAPFVPWKAGEPPVSPALPAETRGCGPEPSATAQAAIPKSSLDIATLATYKGHVRCYRVRACEELPVDHREEVPDDEEATRRFGSQDQGTETSARSHSGAVRGKARGDLFDRESLGERKDPALAVGFAQDQGASRRRCSRVAVRERSGNAEWDIWR